MLCAASQAVTPLYKCSSQEVDLVRVMRQRATDACGCVCCGVG